MALTPRLDLRQRQSLTMTPQMQQAIKLLQLSNLELADYVESELEQNPLLEQDEGASADANPDTGDQGGDQEADQEADQVRDGADAQSAPETETDYEDPWETDGPESFAHERGAGGALGEYTGGIEQTAADRIGLREHLVNQLGVEIGDAADKVIGAHLIDMLDDAGYVDGDLYAIAQRLGCGISRVETTLGRLQGFDPPGVFARSLAECLALQLRDRNRLDPAMQALLDNLALLARGETGELERRCGVDAEDLAEMIAEVTALNPKPGLAFDSEVIQTVIPDVILRQAHDGTWLVELNSDTLPRVLLNRRYYATVRKAARTRDEKSYLAERLTSARWLVRSLDQRANTILRVATELVRRQSAFLEKGVQHLRPMLMREIAAEIDMHESTVSRVTANKYIATPRGTLAMRYFFTTAIASAAEGQTAHSAEAVRHRIRELIEAEEANRPLSDGGLVAILRDDGIEIARRTVAKYREAMRIPSSVERRRRNRRKP